MFLYIQFLFKALIKPHECKKAMQVDKLSLQNINPFMDSVEKWPNIL